MRAISKLEFDEVLDKLLQGVLESLQKVMNRRIQEGEDCFYTKYYDKKRGGCNSSGK